MVRLIGLFLELGYFFVALEPSSAAQICELFHHWRLLPSLSSQPSITAGTRDQFLEAQCVALMNDDFVQELLTEAVEKNDTGVQASRYRACSSKAKSKFYPDVIVERLMDLHLQRCRLKHWTNSRQTDIVSACRVKETLMCASTRQSQTFGGNTRNHPVGVS